MTESDISLHAARDCNVYKLIRSSIIALSVLSYMFTPSFDTNVTITHVRRYQTYNNTQCNGVSHGAQTGDIQILTIHTH